LGINVSLVLKGILNSATTYIILNGVPRKNIKYKSGVSKGYHLSPILFVATAEFLDIAINNASENGFISLPVDHSYGQSFHILHYVNDTLLIMYTYQT
jgi:hypothetical protein